jgi:CHASE2 domain-containing sensor protein
MTMGRSALPSRPEEADSWGEFHARLEAELAGRHSPWTSVGWAVAGLLFGTALICNAYALTDGGWVLWVGMLAALGVVGVLATRAVSRADRNRARALELAELQDAWRQHLDYGAPDYLDRRPLDW